MRNSLRFEILRRDNFTCRYCGAKAPEAVLHVDHVVPRAKGGQDDPLNLVTACSNCNHGKFTKRLEDESRITASTVESERDRVEARRDLIRAYLADNMALEREKQAVVKRLVKLWAKLTPNSYVKLDEATFRQMLSKYTPTVIDQAIRSTAPKVEGRYIRNGMVGAKMYMWGVLRSIQAETECDATIGKLPDSEEQTLLQPNA